MIIPKWAHVLGAIVVTVGTSALSVGFTWATASERANARVETLAVQIGHLREELRGGASALGSTVAKLGEGAHAHGLHLAAVDVRLAYCCPVGVGTLKPAPGAQP